MRRICVVLVLLLSLSTAAVAQSDVFCFCAESTGGCGGNIDVPAFSQRTIYFSLLNPSGGSVSAWEATVLIENESNMIGSWTVLGGGLNVGDETGFIVGMGANYPTANAGNMIPLLSMNVLMLSDAPVLFNVESIPGSTSFYDTPGYRSGQGSFIECESCSSSDLLPAFSINFAIDDEDVEWGKVKTIYGR